MLVRMVEEGGGWWEGGGGGGRWDVGWLADEVGVENVLGDGLGLSSLNSVAAASISWPLRCFLREEGWV